LEDEFRSFVFEVTSSLKTRLEDPAFLKPVEMVKSKHFLLEICFQQLLEVIAEDKTRQKGDK